MSTQEQLAALHSEHSEWQNKIGFYREELKEFNNQLTDLVRKDASSDVLKSVEHFQNQFIRQNEVLDIMRHDFKQHENAIEALQEGKKPVDGDASINEKHSKQIEKLDQFEKLFQEMRNEYHLFLNNVPVS